MKHRKVYGWALLLFCFGLFSALWASIRTGGLFRFFSVQQATTGGQRLTAGPWTFYQNIAPLSTKTMSGGGYTLHGGFSPNTLPVTSAAKDVDQAHAFPVPFKPSIGHTKIRFTKLTSQATISIFTANGELVIELEKPDNPFIDYLDWDVRNNAGEPITSGGYFFVIKNSRGEKKTGKLLIVR